MRRNESMLQPEKQVQLKLGQLVGLVVDPSGNPIEGVAVMLTPGGQPPGDTAQRRLSSTNHNGMVSFDSIQRATYIVRTIRLGMNSQWQEYHGVRGLVDTLCIEMRLSGITLPPLSLGRPPL